MKHPGDSTSILLPVDADALPPASHPPYKSTQLRAPAHRPIKLLHPLAETSGPTAIPQQLREACIDDLTSLYNQHPAGQRIIVSGELRDDRGRAIPEALIELWQANAAGRYAHAADQWNAPLDPYFTGAGRTLTDAHGRYRFITVKPGAYPWGNHDNAWRPAHLHFSILGPCIGARLITQMYFPDDPLLDLDPIANALPVAVRDRLVAHLDMSLTEPSFALGYRFDIVLRGTQQTPLEPEA